MRYNKPLSIGEVLKKELNRAVGEDIMAGLDAMKVIDTWHATLGDVMSRYSCSEHFEKGRLTVRITSSVLRNDLFMQRTELVKRLNDALGERKVIFLELM